MINQSLNIFCIIVAYNPNWHLLNKRIITLSKKFRVVIVSNADHAKSIADFDSIINGRYCKKIALGFNHGIGAAQNHAIRYAIANGAEYLLFLDDDSKIENDVIVKLLEAYNFLSATKLNVAAVAPAVIDADTSKDIVYHLDNSAHYTEIRDLMSSGTLVPIKTIHDVGLFNEALFIDCVDYEWGWRCLRKGLRLYVINSVAISHKLGQSSIKLFGREILRAPSPIRHYYQFRNVIALCLFGRAPPIWRAKQLLQLLIKFPAYLVFLDRKLARLKYMIDGLMDGIRNKLGKYS